MATPRKPTQPRRTTPKKPAVKPSRLAAFDSAADEWKGEPVAFVLDGKTWLCDGSPSSHVVRYLRDPGSVSTLDFISACVVDRKGWDEYLDEHPVPASLLSGISQFLMRVYLGFDPGK